MTTRLRGAALAAVLLFLVAACGSTVAPTPRPSASSTASGAAPAYLPIPINDAYRVGSNRILFGLTDRANNPVATPDRTLTIGYHGPTGQTIAPAKQTFIWAVENVNGVYVGNA